MSRCDKGKSCGSTCIERSDYCRKGLRPGPSRDVRGALTRLKEEGSEKWAGDIVEGLFGFRPNTPAPANNQDDLVLDDVSRLLKGEEPLHIQLTRDNKSRGAGEVTRLQNALGLGDLTKQEVGRDWEVLKEEATRRKDELRKEIKKQRVLGTAKAKAREKELQAELDEINLALQGGKQKQPVSSATKDARINAKYFDEGFSAEKNVPGRASDYDWEGNARSGTNGKKGGFGSVLFQGDTVVKRGDLGEKELEILRKVGEAGIGPELIYGEIGKRKETFASVGIHDGRVAMAKVEGTEIGRFPSSSERIGDSTVGDIYWKARANLHRLGVAHNDAHGDNVIVDSNGNAKFVDFGVSQDNPKAALSEAFGAIVSIATLPPGALVQGGIRRDIQATKVKTSGIGAKPQEQPENLRRIYSNLGKVKAQLRKLGLSNDEIAQVMASGIRNPESFYNKGAWGRLTNQQAFEIIQTLYDGI